MISTLLLAILLVVVPIELAAAQSLSVVCAAGQCMQGISNTTLGAVLNAPGAPAALQLLPGVYTSTTNPQLLHNIITSSGASLTSSPGFNNASQAFNPSSLPLQLTMSPGMVVYDGTLYSGQARYSGFPEVVSDPNAAPAQVGASSFALSDNVYIILGEPGGGNGRIVVWNSVPDVTQLPSSSTNLSIFGIISSACNPPCTSSGVCSPTSNSCVCAPGFNGTSCESCSSGFFGPTCQACPSGCIHCDDGLTGTGVCLDKPTSGGGGCECGNGQCGNDGLCTCNDGWTDGSDGKKCSVCKAGFFLTSAGDCQACQFGCSQCVATTGQCAQCIGNLSPDAVDNTKCRALSPGGNCSNGFLDHVDHDACKPCHSSCESCTGPGPGDCTICQFSLFMLNETCTVADAGGQCQSPTGGGVTVANNANRKCDACPVGCISCKYPGFNFTATLDQAQCTTCLPGLVLSQGRCFDACPAGTVISPANNLTCIPCDPACTTCASSPEFCTACSGHGQVAFNGNCFSSCPPNMFIFNSTTCASCHGDCATCSGPQFNQCLTCPASRPVLKDGRCLPTCAETEFLDRTSASCVSCDSSCGTCSSAGSGSCLSCPDGQILRQGRCVGSSGCTTLKGLGVCLNELVAPPPPISVTSSQSTVGPSSVAPVSVSAPVPMPSISGIAEPTKVTVVNKLHWWQILLMVLGGLFLALIVFILWRRLARKKRMKETEVWATQKGVTGGQWWKRMFAWRGRKRRSMSLEKEGGLPSYRGEQRRWSGMDEGFDANADERLSWEQGSESSIESRSVYSEEIKTERRTTPIPRLRVRELSPPVASLPNAGRAAKRDTVASRASSKRIIADLGRDTDVRYPRFSRREPPTRQMEKIEEHTRAEPFIAEEPLEARMEPTTTGTGFQSRNPFRY